MVVIINIQIVKVKILITIGDIRGLDGGLTMVDGEIKYIEHRALVDKNGEHCANDGGICDPGQGGRNYIIRIW